MATKKPNNSGAATFKLEERGNLFAVDHSKLQFTPVRTFVVSKVPRGQIRGGHAHRLCNQHLFVVYGIIAIHYYDGKTAQDIVFFAIKVIRYPKECHYSYQTT